MLNTGTCLNTMDEPTASRNTSNDSSVSALMRVSLGTEKPKNRRPRHPVVAICVFVLARSSSCVRAALLVFSYSHLPKNKQGNFKCTAVQMLPDAESPDTLCQILCEVTYMSAYIIPLHAVSLDLPVLQYTGTTAPRTHACTYTIQKCMHSKARTLSGACSMHPYLACFMEVSIHRLLI